MDNWHENPTPNLSLLQDGQTVLRVDKAGGVGAGGGHSSELVLDYIKNFLTDF